MPRSRFILSITFLLCVISLFAQGRIARFQQGIFLYSNWDAPGMALDTCLDKSITEVQIPETIVVNGRSYPVWEIGPGAFNGCRNLKIVYFNHYVSPMMRSAFHNCPNLRVLVTPQAVPPKMEECHPFYGGKFADIFEPYHAQSVILVVPSGSEEAYRNTPGWKEFQNIQSTMPTEEQLNNGVIESRIHQLENELQQARQYVQRLEDEINVLKQASP